MLYVSKVQSGLRMTNTLHQFDHEGKRETPNLQHPASSYKYRG